MPAVLVTRRLPSTVLSKLHAIADVDLYTGNAAIPAAELRARVADKDALVCLLADAVDRPVIDAAARLKVVANVALAYNNIDVPYARSRNIVVTNTPDVLTESVADFTWALILAITRRLAEGERLVRRGEWKGWALDFMLGSELRGKQLGLVGVGRIGRAVAARAPAFGMKVAYTTRSRVGLNSGTGDGGAEAMSLDRLLLTSDIVSLHVPLTPETRHLIDKRALTRMKRSAYLINTSRGPGGGRGIARVGAAASSALRGGARRLRTRADRASRSAASRERPAGSASRQRHDGNAHRDGRSRGRQRGGSARGPPAVDAGSLTGLLSSNAS